MGFCRAPARASLRVHFGSSGGWGEVSLSLCVLIRVADQDTCPERGQCAATGRQEPGDGVQEPRAGEPQRARGLDTVDRGVSRCTGRAVAAQEAQTDPACL